MLCVYVVLTLDPTMCSSRHGCIYEGVWRAVTVHGRLQGDLQTGKDSRCHSCCASTAWSFALWVIFEGLKVGGCIARSAQAFGECGVGQCAILQLVVRT